MSIRVCPSPVASVLHPHRLSVGPGRTPAPALPAPPSEWNIGDPGPVYPAAATVGSEASRGPGIHNGNLCLTLFLDLSSKMPVRPEKDGQKDKIMYRRVGTNIGRREGGRRRCRGREDRDRDRESHFERRDQLDVSPGEEASSDFGSLICRWKRGEMCARHQRWPRSPSGRAGTVHRLRCGQGSTGVHGDPAERMPHPLGPRAPILLRGKQSQKCPGKFRTRPVLVRLIRETVYCHTSTAGMDSRNCCNPCNCVSSLP